MPRGFKNVFDVLGALAAVTGLLIHPIISGNLSSDGKFDGWLFDYTETLSYCFFAIAFVFVLTRFLLPRWYILPVLATGLMLLFLEMASAGYLYWFEEGGAHRALLEGMYVFHPHLGIMPAPNLSYVCDCSGPTVHYIHNEDGFRAPPRSRVQEVEKRIVVIGGSSAYDPAVADGKTFPQIMSKMLGAKVEVFNLGVPGHATTQHIVMTALWASEYKPDVIVYYFGWNDIRNSHIMNLKPDFSDFHVPSLYHSVQLDKNRYSASAFLAIIKRAMLGSGFIEGLPLPRKSGKISSTIDTRLLGYFRRNVRTLAAISKSIDAIAVFVPQILNDEQLLASKGRYGWVPFVLDRDLPSINRVFNQAMIEEANANSWAVNEQMEDLDWRLDDFVDQGHFSSSGSEKFAREIVRFLKKQKLLSSE